MASKPARKSSDEKVRIHSYVYTCMVDTDMHCVARPSGVNREWLPKIPSVFHGTVAKASM